MAQLTRAMRFQQNAPANFLFGAACRRRPVLTSVRLRSSARMVFASREVACAMLIMCGLAVGRSWGGQPDAAVVPGLEPEIEGVDPGEILLGELNCTTCHWADTAVETRLMPKQAPLLGQLGTRVQPGYLAAYISDPHRKKPGTTMPDLMHGLTLAEKEVRVRELVQFLMSMAAAPPLTNQNAAPLDLEQGRLLYHRAGCVACHPPQESAGTLFAGFSGGGPTDPQAIQFVLDNLNRLSVPLGNPEEKYRPSGLEAFLRDPLEARPAGRMPSLNLSSNESLAITRYLQQNTPQLPVRSTSGAPSSQSDLGRQYFATLGCASCHQRGPRGPKIDSLVKAPPLARIDPEKAGGCLDAHPRQTAARFFLSEPQRAAARNAIEHRASLHSRLEPTDAVRNRIVRLNCVGCHSRGGGGPAPSRADYFVPLANADLGDEGRLPPHLIGVGRKLRAAWLREVLLERGTVRPYLATRMPQYGSNNVEMLVEQLRAADAPVSLLQPDNSVKGDPETGRLLVGTSGCACISCHTFGPFKSAGISVMDLTRTAPRLHKDWFRPYLIDPQSLRPGTRMPSFWPDEKTTVPALLEGDTDGQIEAIWTYLSQGANAAPPPGIDKASVSAP